ncbi:Integrase [Devosia sp. DBB001]|nr:Integrase [Devosia sp. DBB001]
MDANGKRRRKMFGRKKDADAFLLTAKSEVREGVHVADADTITVAEAGKLWIKSGEAAGLERTTIDQRRQHLELHIKPFIGDVRLNKATVPWVRAFQEKLRDEGRSPAMVKRVTVSLGSIIADAQDRGLAVRNPVHERSRARSTAKSTEKRAKAKVVVGVDIPLPEEIKAFLGGLAGRWRPFFLTAVFTGMRASELRGLTWANVDLDGRIIHVRQRADAYNAMGRPKSEAGERAIPIPPIVANALKEWKLACPRKNRGSKEAPDLVLDLVFPNGAGGVENHGNIINRGLVPAMRAAGVSVESGELDEQGAPILAAKYTGLHALRHFYASWCINPVSAGGQGLAPKVVQERLGHATIAMTLDVYGHLFPRGDDGDALAVAAAALVQ